MKIDINKIPPEGFTLEEEASAGHLDLDSDAAKFKGPIRINAQVSKITNAVSVSLDLAGLMQAQCSRCLNEFTLGIKKDLKLNFPVDKSDPVIDLDADIREEIILGYPIKFLCSENCKGLCPKCGKNLNEGGCFCGTTKKTSL